jgi:hypothetical protein
MKNINLIITLSIFVIILPSCRSKFENIEFRKIDEKKIKEASYVKKVDVLYDGNIIQRKIEGSPFFHFGVIKGDKIIHFDDNGVHTTTLQEFSKGFPVKLTSEKNVDLEKRLYVLDKYRKTKYDMFTNNCEHFAYELVFDKKISKQTDDVMLYLKKSAPVMENYLLKKYPQHEDEIKLLIQLSETNKNK